MVDQVAEAAAQIKEQGFSTLGAQAYNRREGSGAIGLQASYPAKYDLRDEGVVTPVKFQNPWGTCWGFSAIAASETSILSELKAAGADYSASPPRSTTSPSASSPGSPTPPSPRAMTAARAERTWSP